MAPSLEARDIEEALVAASQTLEKCRYRYCVFGSAACYMYFRIVRVSGPRVPKDVDIVVFPDTSVDAEQIKREMVEQDPQFYLEDSRKDPNAPYQVLWFCPQDRPPVNAKAYKGCKVNILVDEDAETPSGLKIPRVSPEMANSCFIQLSKNTSTISQPKKNKTAPDGSFQVYMVPALMLLFLKLKSWEDHRASNRTDFKKKALNDVQDLLLLAQRAVFTQSQQIGLGRLELKAQFWTDTRRRALDFLSQCFQELSYKLWFHWIEYQLFDVQALQAASSQYVSGKMPYRQTPVIGGLRRYPLPERESRTPRDLQDVCEVVQALSGCMAALSYRCCFSGAVAAFYYFEASDSSLDGIHTQTPEVIEIVVFSVDQSLTRPFIQHQLIQKEPRFYHSHTEDEDEPRGDFWYSFGDGPRVDVSRSVKVHVILWNAEAMVPFISPDETVVIPVSSETPRDISVPSHHVTVVPPIALLLLLLQDWAERLRISGHASRQKSLVHALAIVDFTSCIASLEHLPFLHPKDWPPWFTKLGQHRARHFMKDYITNGDIDIDLTHWTRWIRMGLLCLADVVVIARDLRGKPDKLRRGADIFAYGAEDLGLNEAERECCGSREISYILGKGPSPDVNI
ncbi:hypothetical protein V5O48_016080 [Marasmius crinis-equi]|uniref:Uncharacterized protein n=1 Tax=Marasmius crinis-equi TaxID=585013 RepID=A0ABR3ET21_9AGAR